MVDNIYVPKEVAGESGVWNQEAWADDPKGTLGYLRFPYQKAALGFEFDTAATPANAWVLQRDTITVGDSGVGDTDTSTGYSGEQTEADTSLLKNGFFSSTSHFTVTGIAIRASSNPVVPTDSTGGGTTSFVVNRAGQSLNNCQGIAGTLVKSGLEGAYIEFYQQSRKCFALYGLVEEMPQGFGFASMNDVTNGLVGKCNMERSRRPVIIPPGNSNTPEYVWRITFGRKVSVPADPSFAAPADNDDCAIGLCFFFDGYFSDGKGNPLVADGDVYEARIAAGVC